MKSVIRGILNVAQRKAFSLIELLLVMIVIGALALIAAPKMKRVLEIYRAREAEETLEAIRSEQEQRCVVGQSYQTDKSKMSLLSSNNTGKDFIYTLQRTGATANREEKEYKIRMISYKTGALCCEGSGCEMLNKGYQECTEAAVLAALADECAGDKVIKEIKQENMSCTGSYTKNYVGCKKTLYDDDTYSEDTGGEKSAIYDAEGNVLWYWFDKPSLTPPSIYVGEPGENKEEVLDFLGGGTFSHGLHTGYYFDMETHEPQAWMETWTGDSSMYNTGVASMSIYYNADGSIREVAFTGANYSRITYDANKQVVSSSQSGSTTPANYNAFRSTTYNALNTIFENYTGEVKTWDDVVTNDFCVDAPNSTRCQ